MRLVMFGHGPLCDAVSAALSAHDLVARYDSPQSINTLRSAQAQVGLAVGYRPIMPKAERECFPLGVLNLHFSLLPWCAGVGGNAWPIVEGCPAGVTLHWMDDGVDTGPTVAQEEVPVEPWDTAGTLLEKQGAAAVRVIAAVFQAADSEGLPVGERIGVRSRHLRKDFAKLEGLDLDAPTTARQVLNLLRARTCPPYAGLRYRQDGKLIEATITLKEVTE